MLREQWCGSYSWIPCRRRRLQQFTRNEWKISSAGKCVQFTEYRVTILGVSLLYFLIYFGIHSSLDPYCVLVLVLCSNGYNYNLSYDFFKLCVIVWSFMLIIVSTWLWKRMNLLSPPIMTVFVPNFDAWGFHLMRFKMHFPNLVHILK